MRPPLPWGLILTLPLRGSVAANGKIKSPTNFPILRWPQLGSFWLVSYHNMRGIPQLGPASTGPPSTGGSSKSFYLSGLQTFVRVRVKAEARLLLVAVETAPERVRGDAAGMSPSNE